MPSSLDSNHSEVHESLLLLNDILSVCFLPDLRGLIWLLQLPNGPIAQRFNLAHVKDN